jgi:hypothetical protein
VVRATIDPVGGIISKIGRAPDMRQLTDHLIGETARQELFERHAAMPKPVPLSHHIDYEPLPQGDLFVACVVPGYDAMLARHLADGGRRSRMDERICKFDGGQHVGVWVPHRWWDERKAGTAPKAEPRPPEMIAGIKLSEAASATLADALLREQFDT